MTATFGRASNRVCIYTDAPKQRQFCSLLNRVVKMGCHATPPAGSDDKLRRGLNLSDRVGDGLTMSWPISGGEILRLPLGVGCGLLPCVRWPRLLV